MKKGIAWLIDSLCIVALCYLTYVWISGGGEYRVGPILIRAHSGGAVLPILMVVSLLRVWTLPSVPWLACQIVRRGVCDLVWQRVRNFASSRTAVEWIAALVLLSFLIKLGNAYFSEGFFSGDDTELLSKAISGARGLDYTAWQVRNSFYPTVFLEPAVTLADRLGASTGTLVLVARLVVISISCAALPLVYWVTKKAAHGSASPSAAGIIAAAILLLSPPETQYASSVLPRPVEGVALIGAILALRGRSALRVGLAGMLIGIAAAVRFSEIILFPAAFAALVWERRWTDAVVVPAIGLATSLALWAAFDVLDGNPAFSSLRAIFDYTVVSGQSSRGFQPVYYYLTSSITWIGVPSLLFLGWAARRPRSSLWAWMVVPILMLSALPHKETRYIVPILPVMAALSGIGVVRWAHWTRNSLMVGRHWNRLLGRPVLAVVCALAVVYGIDGQKFSRSDGAVRAARYLAAYTEPLHLAIQQPWKAGASFYLPRDSVVSLDPSRLRSGDTSELVECLDSGSVDATILQCRVVSNPQVQEILREHGLTRVVGPWESDHDPHCLFERTATGDE